jgi:hypothetical protein
VVPSFMRAVRRFLPAPWDRERALQASEEQGRSNSCATLVRRPVGLPHDVLSEASMLSGPRKKISAGLMNPPRFLLLIVWLISLFVANGKWLSSYFRLTLCAIIDFPLWFYLDRLDENLMQNCGMEVIAPNRAKRCQTQHERPLRRYVRRSKSERFFAWLFNYRRLVVRVEYHAEHFQGFLHLAAAGILSRHL